MGDGKKLQEILKDRSVSVAKLSKDTGISTNTLYALIKRDSKINNVTANKIAASLNMTLEEFSELLLDATDEADNVELQSHVVDSGIEIVKDVKTLIRQLNNLTDEYNYRMSQILELRQRIAQIKRQRDALANEECKLEIRLKTLENEVENREVELRRIRDKLN